LIEPALYISITGGFILNIYFFKTIKNLINKFIEYEFFIKISDRFYNEKLVLFYIYLSYFITLLILTFCELNEYDIIGCGTNFKANKVVLQSFTTFLALERLTKYYNENVTKKNN